MEQHYEGHWKGWALKIETEMATSEASTIWAQGPTPSNAPSNDVARLKTIKYKRHKNSRYIGNFMYTSVEALLCVGMWVSPMYATTIYITISNSIILTPLVSRFTPFRQRWAVLIYSSVC
jgi:hypothetical protein